MTDSQYEGHIAYEGQGPVDPYVEPDTTPERAAAAPDLVLAAQRTYTRAIQDTVWATLASWTPGSPVSKTILEHFRNAGYSSIVSADPDAATGIVTITATTAAEISAQDWAAFDGTLGADIVATTLPWTSVGISTAAPVSDTVPVPMPNHLISLWSHLERQGVRPASLYRHFDAEQDRHDIVIHTYGAIGGDVEIILGEYELGEVNNSRVNDFLYQSVAEEEVSQFLIKAESNPFSDNAETTQHEGLVVTTKPVKGLELETGYAFGDMADVFGESLITAPTATVPVQVQESQTPALFSSPGYFDEADGFTIANPPLNPREGDIWYVSGVYRQRIDGAWSADVSLNNILNAGSLAVGRESSTTGQTSLAVGWLARAIGNAVTAMGSRSRADDGSSTAIGTGARSKLRAIALGVASRALGDSSIAIGNFAAVPVTSPRSIAIGNDVVVPENFPDIAFLKINRFEIIRSNGAGETVIVLHSANGSGNIIAATDDGALKVNSTPLATEAGVTGSLDRLRPISGTDARAADALNTGSTTTVVLDDPTVAIAVDPTMAHVVTARFFGFIGIPLGGSLELTVGDSVSGAWGGAVFTNPVAGTFYSNPVVVHSWIQPAGQSVIQARARWETGAATGYSLHRGSTVEVEAKPFFS